jgi:HEAT repeat protein
VTPLAPAVLAGTAVSGLVVLLLAAVAVVHLGRTRRADRDARRRAELTPMVLALLDDEDGTGGSPAPGIASAPAVLDEVVLGLLPQLRGGDRRVLQQVLATRGVVARAAGDLHARAAWRRGRAATLLGSTASRYHTAELSALLRDRNGEVRCAAARALGKAGDPTAIGALLASVDAERALPAGVVGMAVLDLGTPVLPALRDTLADGGPHARTLAAEVLGLHGDLAAAPALEALVRDPATGAVVRRAAAGALGRIGSPTSTDPLVRALATADLAAAAAEALGRVGDPFALPALLTGLSAARPEVRTACAAALAALGPEGRSELAAAAGRPDHEAAARAAQAALDGLALAPRRPLVGA